jgi:hypothetical protein
LEQRKQKLKNCFEKLAINKAQNCAPTRFAGELSKKLLVLNIKKIETKYGLELNQFNNTGLYEKKV